MAKNTSDQQYWNHLYQSNDTGWDIGYPSPALKDYIDQFSSKHLSILIPGCGNSYEAAYLLEKGFTNITLIDIAPLLTATLQTTFRDFIGKQLKIITGDFFDLSGQYDLILEQTFLSALDPSLRKNYAARMHALLKPGGKLVGVLFNRVFDDGPPFGGSIAAYEELFQPLFYINTISPCYNSIERRAGSEAFINLTAKP